MHAIMEIVTTWGVYNPWFISLLCKGNPWYIRLPRFYDPPVGFAVSCSAVKQREHLQDHLHEASGLVPGVHQVGLLHFLLRGLPLCRGHLQ